MRALAAVHNAVSTGLLRVLLGRIAQRDCSMRCSEGTLRRNAQIGAQMVCSSGSHMPRMRVSYWAQGRVIAAEAGGRATCRAPGDSHAMKRVRKACSVCASAVRAACARVWRSVERSSVVQQGSGECSDVLVCSVRGMCWGVQAVARR